MSRKNVMYALLMFNGADLTMRARRVKYQTSSLKLFPSVPKDFSVPTLLRTYPSPTPPTPIVCPKMCTGSTPQVPLPSDIPPTGTEHFGPDLIWRQKIDMPSNITQIFYKWNH